MSTNHRERIERIVDKALKEAALGEPYGFAVSPCAIWPVPITETESKSMPAWFLLVTIRATLVGQPDIGNGFPVGGILPDDESFRSVARALLGKCLQERAQTMTGPSMALSERPA